MACFIRICQVYRSACNSSHSLFLEQIQERPIDAASPCTKIDGLTPDEVQSPTELSNRQLVQPSSLLLPNHFCQVMTSPIAPAPDHDVFSLYARLLVEEHIPKEEMVGPAPQGGGTSGLPLIPSQSETASSQPSTLQFVPIKAADKEPRSLGIPFEILEAQNRTGGRLYTHKFIKKDEKGDPLLDQPKHDYYDVGAMRYPKTNIMKRLFHLFHLLKLTEENGKLIPYVFACEKAFKMYNGIRKTIGDVKTHSTEPDKVDPFRFARDHGGDVSNDFIYPGYSSLYSDAITPFSDALANDLKPGAQPANAGWRKLMRFDEYSTRGYMSECMNSQIVLTYLIGILGSATSGGSQKLSDAMEANVREKPLVEQVIKFGHLVSAIQAVPEASKTTPSGKEPRVQAMRVSFTTRGKDGKLKTEKKEYDHVISTIPLPTLRTLDIDKARLNFKQKNALRILQYGPSIKVGVKFTKAWWKGLEIKGGQSYTDRCIRAVAYPSYPKADDPSTVLMASYCWQHDAVRMGALINAGEEADMRLKDLVLRDLAEIHKRDYEELKAMYIEHFAFDWTHDPLTQGAFAFFGPGEFSTVYRSLTSFAADGRLHFAGEALSVRHAWVVGALDSAWRAVLEVLSLSYRRKLKKFYGLWGKNQEWISTRRTPNTTPHLPTGPILLPGTGGPDYDEDDLMFRHMYHQNPEFFQAATQYIATEAEEET
ncbi:hypothetical protein FRB96_007842 [Tulasnella sp. 330]|nr:hypothetical protein FRB96_007842 [Tulasnella sp. 330]